MTCGYLFSLIFQQTSLQHLTENPILVVVVVGVGHVVGMRGGGTDVSIIMRPPLVEVSPTLEQSRLLPSGRARDSRRGGGR